MPTAAELLKQGKHEELWDMCCGFLSLNVNQFMEIQERLLIKQLELLGSSALGRKIMRGATPKTVEEFRRTVPLTSYKDYCPELLEKREDVLPGKPHIWAHSSGRTGEYRFKWIPITEEYARELSTALYGVGILSCCEDWRDMSRMLKRNKVLYSVASRPYISGIFADLLRMQIPIDYYPPIEDSEALTFEERIQKGFSQALTQGFDYFFGLSLVLVTVGDKLKESSNKTSIRPYLTRPRALWRLARGKFKSRLARRPMLPRDLWKIRGIIGSGTDSWVYKERIKEYWGRRPLDLYSCTEGGVIACQTWDYDGMTFIPNLNFLEFIPEEEQIKNAMDSSYQPRTLTLDEVEADKSYELVITNFHGGSLVRYRPGDIVRITSLANTKLGIEMPQMAFERRVDDVIDLVFVRLTEKLVWQAIENTGVPYEDWVACKKPGESVMTVYLELKDPSCDAFELAESIYQEIIKSDEDSKTLIPDEYADMIDFKVVVKPLPRGTFSRYTALKQAEGADVAHLKPFRLNPPGPVLEALLEVSEETIEVIKVRKADTVRAGH